MARKPTSEELEQRAKELEKHGTSVLHGITLLKILLESNWFARLIQFQQT